MHKGFCSPISSRKEEPLISYSITGAFEGEKSTEKRQTNKEEKVNFHQNNAPCHKSIASMAKQHELRLELLPHLHFSDLAPRDYWLFADLKGILQGKIFGSNEKLISEAYFEAKNKSSTEKALNC